MTSPPHVSCAVPIETEDTKEITRVVRLDVAIQSGRSAIQLLLVLTVSQLFLPTANKNITILKLIIVYVHFAALHIIKYPVSQSRIHHNYNVNGAHYPQAMESHVREKGQ